MKDLFMKIFLTLWTSALVFTLIYIHIMYFNGEILQGAF